MSSTLPVQVDTKSAGGTANALTSSTLAPVTGLAYLCFVSNTKAASVSTPTLSGTGGFSVTWTQVQTEPNAGATQRLTCFRGVASSTSAGAVTADFAGVDQTGISLLIIKCLEINTATNQGVQQSVVSTATSASPSVTFAAFTRPSNVAIMVSLSAATTTWTNSTTGWTPFPAIQGPGTTGAIVRAHTTLDVSPVGTFGSSASVTSIGVELTTTDRVPISETAVAAFISQAGPNFFRGTTTTGTREIGYGGGGPSGYAASDPTGVQAKQDPNTALAGGYTRGFWPAKTQRSDTEGNATPSQVQSRNGDLYGIYVPLAAGSHSISLDLKAEMDTGVLFRPQLIVKADPYLGVYSDVVTAAASGTAWQTVTANVTLALDGVLCVVRRKRGPDHVRVWWDNLSVT